MSKAKCECGKKAVWIYMPGYGDGSSPYSCNDCVISPEDNIGCSCNWRYSKKQKGLPTDLPEGIEGKDWKWVEHAGDEYISKITKKDGYWQYIDENGRPYPCAEYEYDEDGFTIPTIFTKINDYFWWRKHFLVKGFKKWWEKHICIKVPDDLDT